ncbi:MAG TPA: hypothetical protein VF098_02565 [Sphingomicrobium sp.]|jgi:hypothetical protein
MIAALLLAAAAASSSPASGMTAVDAEHAFIRDAQKKGQWTAFRKWADRDSVMFTPQAVWVHQFLKDRKDPPKAVRWAPAQSFVSCDGRTAVNTGPWWGADGVHHGYFTTVWQRAKPGWRWVYDGGAVTTDGSPAPVTVPLRVQAASCRGKASGAPIKAPRALTPKQSTVTPEDSGRGESADKTLGWDWKVDKNGGRTLRVFQWRGSHYAQVLTNNVPPETR